MNETNEKPDKRFLIVVLVFGLAASGASAHWLNSGEIAIRSGAAEGAPQHGGRIVGQIAGDRVLFYPICIAWALLGVTMIALSGLAFVRNETVLMKLSAYACAALLLLVMTTSLAAWLLKPS